MKDFRKGGITHGLIGGGYEGEEIIVPLAKLKKLLNLTEIPYEDSMPGGLEYDNNKTKEL